MKLRVGIAGFGKIGKIRYNELLKFSNIEVVGIYDLKNSEENLPKSIKLSSTIDELFDLNIDAIFICTFNNVLAEYTQKALTKGVHVFCEKPGARSIEELNRIAEVFEKSNKRLKYGFNHRYHYSVMEAKKMIESGDFGKVLWMRGVYGKAGSIDYDKNWRNYKKFSGGGILIDQGIHMLDLMQYLSNKKFTQSTSYITNSFWKIESEDNAFAILKSKDNVVGMLHSSATQWKHKFLLEICLEDGYLNLDGILSTTRSYAPEKLIKAKREFEDITFAMGKPEETVTWFENDDSWFLEVKEFIESIEQNRKITSGTIYDAIEMLRLVGDIYNNTAFVDETE